MCVGTGVGVSLCGVHLTLFRCIKRGWFNHKYTVYNKQIHTVPLNNNSSRTHYLLQIFSHVVGRGSSPGRNRPKSIV